MSLEENYRKLLALVDSKDTTTEEVWISGVIELAQQAVVLLEQNSRIVRVNHASTKTISTQESVSSALPSNTRYSDAARVSNSTASQKIYSEKREKRRNVEELPKYLPILAQLVSMRPDQSKLQEAFTTCALLHFFDPILFPLLVESFKANGKVSDQNNYAVECQYQVPSWWPPLQESLSTENTSIHSPLEYCHSLRGNAHYQLKHLVGVTLTIINLLEDVTSKVSSQTLGALLNISHCFVEDESLRDVAILVLCHSKEAIEALYSLSILGISESIKTQASKIMDLMSTRQSLISVLCFLFALPGAHRLMGMYSQKQRSAYELISKRPFEFVLDLLDHSSISTEPRKPILITCIAIASQSIANLSIADTTTLYSNFNKVSKTRSMYVVLCSFGIETVKFALSIKRDIETMDVIKLILDELNSSLPPFSKPNYFFVDRRPPNTNGLMKELESIYDTADLAVSLHLILTTLKVVTENELQQVFKITSIPSLSSRILANNFKYFLILSLSALLSNTKKESVVSRDFCKGAIACIGRIIFDTFNENISDLYVALFNFGNDVCHLHTVAIPSVGELIMILIQCRDISENQELVLSAIELFRSTFGNLDQSMSSTEISVEVQKNDYGFLYDKKELLK